jgi:prephenate dehydrogenase
MFNSVRIIGSGLIGTSLGLTLKAAGKRVEMQDIDPINLEMASNLVKSQILDVPDLILIAAPIEVTKDLVLAALLANPNSVVCDLASVKSDLQVEVMKLSDQASKFISLHPMAGRETSGAENARADLFDGRAWLAINNPHAQPAARLIVKQLIAICRGKLYWFEALEHDQIVAKLSHLPQILSSALAGELINVSENQLNIAGQGLRDITRLAKSNPKLWSQILIQNQPSVLVALDSLIFRLNNLRNDLLNKDQVKIFDFLNLGVAGKNRIPGKHGSRQREYSYLPIVIDDKPGQLANIFNLCAQISVNIEDLNIEHSPGQETGLVTLALAVSDADKLSSHLTRQGLKVHPVKNR